MRFDHRFLVVAMIAVTFFPMPVLATGQAPRRQQARTVQLN
ncbi:hypothetical protein AB0756_39540 [Tolypothrix campylonemoides VB511288_2]|uniref:Uncharacterized protein n=2 Tax=Nostocales TaxID=1161 RepID=A0ABW8WK00_9CYAN